MLNSNGICNNIYDLLFLVRIKYVYYILYIEYRHRNRNNKELLITGSIEKAELFDWPPPLQDFWELLLCHGGRLVDEFSVSINDVADVCKSRPAEYRWYPGSLLKSLLMVSAI